MAKEIEDISAGQGVQAASNRLARVEVILNLRKPSLAIYDHAFHFIGGAQKYGLTLISALQDQFDITILANKNVRHKDFQDWYNLDLSKCRIKVIKLPYYEKKAAAHLDPAFITRQVENPFHLISRESGEYDIFVNNSMNEMVYPLSIVSVLICHFPERRPKSYFYADRYTNLVYNSRYTAEWIEKKWKLTPQHHIYPPVDMESGGAEYPKKKQILSVARFEPEGTNRQLEMIEAFLRLSLEWPEIVRGWRFILAGGSHPNNRYLTRLEEMVGKNPAQNIELKVNLPAAELESLYRDSTLFWHLCGVKSRDPGEVEHFGMTTVEAMQNGLVPLVYDGGGLREIVDHGENGFRVRSGAELLEFSVRLLEDPEITRQMSRAAKKKSEFFTRARFEARVKDLFEKILESYTLVG